ncbi:MAG: hypothetical protein B7Y90_07240 [Alphaproteobacteria bacterium 32-64-14]|nr:MAG: hypothetical protein B7Y90_07240 [Alphaproteobacteria bacterium 32-64-14]
MTVSQPFLTRRAALRLAALSVGAWGVGGLVLAPQALAAPGVRFPMRIACMRVGNAGFLQIRHDEQTYWSQMQLRLGGLIERLTPIQPSDMMGANLVHVEGGPNCAMVARQAAARWGFSHVVLYATHDGQNHYASDGSWWSDLFATMQSEFDKDGRATGEAHLLDVEGGPALASASVDAAPRDPLNLFDGGRNPERETLARLTQGLELELQDIARRAYDSQRSIAD